MHSMHKSYLITYLQPFLPISKENQHNNAGIKLQQYVQYQKKNNGGKTLSRTFSAQKEDYSLPEITIGTPNGNHPFPHIMC